VARPAKNVHVPDVNYNYLQGGKTPAERSSHYQKHNSGTRTVKLGPSRHAKLLEQESKIHDFASSKPGRELGRAMLEKHGVKPDQALQGPDAHKRASGVNVTTIDPAKESQARKETRMAAKKRAPKARTYKPSAIGAKARAAANNLAGLEHSEANVKSTRTGAKASETDHLQTQQFGGKHHASSAASAVKNAYGSMSAMSSGKRSAENSGYVGKHRGAYSPDVDAHRVALSGSISYGKHSATGVGRVRGNFEPLKRAA
jgi:hypothetical protein